MANYFKKYPKILYNGRVVTDLIARTVIKQKYSDKLSVYYPYDLQDGDTPEIIAYKYYGDAEKHWLVLLANETMDPFFDFSLPYTEFENYITSKYAQHSNSLSIWDNGTWQGIWDSGVSYSANDIVCFGNTAYNCVNSHTSIDFSNDFTSSYWTTIYDGNFWKSDWENNTYYAEQDVARHNSTLYVCLQNHTSNTNNSVTISNADYWKTYSNPIEFTKVTVNLDPPGYRAVISTTDISSGDETVNRVFIDKKAFFDNYLDDTFSYPDITLIPQGEDPDVIYTQTKEKVHIYDYEMELNESKRQIKLIRAEYAGQLEKELKYLMEQQYG